MAIRPHKDQVQCTNDEATATKAHAVRRGYWIDPFIKHFCPLSSSSTPEINRGYFIRVKTFEAMVVRFIQDCSGDCQVVNLGAGSDTLFFKLKSRCLLPKAFVEVDLPANVSKKIATIKKSETLWKLLCEDDCKNALASNETETYLKSGCYHLFSFDLRLPANNLCDALCTSERGPKLSSKTPTLFLAECVLVYIPASCSETLLSTLAQHFENAAFLNYEQVNMNDKFGEIMIQSFRDRCCELPGLSACGSLDDQKKRFCNAGWNNTNAWTIHDIYNFFPSISMQRIAKLEILDDREITKQLYEHYCIILATNTPSICNWESLSYALSDIE